MTFPATPANDARHTENGVEYIGRNGRWERFERETAHSVNLPTNSGRQELQIPGDAPRATAMIHIEAAFTNGSDSNVSFQLGTAADWLMQPGMTGGHPGIGYVEWGGGGAHNEDWAANSPVTYAEGFSLNWQDSTRLFQRGKPHFADIKIMRVWDFKEKIGVFVDCWQIAQSGSMPMRNTYNFMLDADIRQVISFKLSAHTGWWSGGSITMRVF